MFRYCLLSFTHIDSILSANQIAPLEKIDGSYCILERTTRTRKNTFYLWLQLHIQDICKHEYRQTHSLFDVYNNVNSFLFVFLAFDLCRFCVVMTSDFEGFSISDFIHYIYFPILILEKEPVFSPLNVQC